MEHALVALRTQADVFLVGLHLACKTALAVLAGLILAVSPVAYLDGTAYAVKCNALSFPCTVSEIHGWHWKCTAVNTGRAYGLMVLKPFFSSRIAILQQWGTYVALLAAER